MIQFLNTNDSYAWYLPCQRFLLDIISPFIFLYTLLLRFIEKKKMFCTFWFSLVCLGLINFLWVQRSEFIIYFTSFKRVDNRFSLLNSLFLLLLLLLLVCKKIHLDKCKSIVTNDMCNTLLIRKCIISLCAQLIDSDSSITAWCLCIWLFRQCHQYVFVWISIYTFLNLTRLFVFVYTSSLNLFAWEGRLFKISDLLRSSIDDYHWNLRCRQFFFCRSKYIWLDYLPFFITHLH